MPTGAELSRENYRIFTNKTSAHGEQPWVAIIKLVLDDPFRCGGSLINSQFILTGKGKKLIKEKLFFKNN